MYSNNNCPIPNVGASSPPVSSRREGVISKTDGRETDSERVTTSVRRKTATPTGVSEVDGFAIYVGRVTKR